MIQCDVHNIQVDGYEVRTRFALVGGRMVRAVEEYSFPCGCSFPFANISVETVVDQEVTNDGTRIVELTISDLAGNPIMSWVEARETVDTF